MKRTHLPRGGPLALTLCGRPIERVQLIGRNEVVDAATCQACQRADTASQLREYRADCKRAGVPVGHL